VSMDTEYHDGGDDVSDTSIDEALTVAAFITLKTRLAELEAENERLTRSRDGWEHDAQVYARNATRAKSPINADTEEFDRRLVAVEKRINFGKFQPRRGKLQLGEEGE